MLDTSKNTLLQQGINELCEAVLNPLISRYGAIKEFHIVGGKISVKLTLLGMEEVPFEVSCESISIADDASTVALNGIKANKAFLENALRTFAAKPIEVPPHPAARAGLKILKAILV